MLKKKKKTDLQNTPPYLSLAPPTDEKLQSSKDIPETSFVIWIITTANRKRLNSDP